MEWMEGDYRGAHLSNKGQKLLTVKAMQSVIFLMHKVWMFITPHIITEHSRDPEALRIPLTPYSISLSLPLSHTFAVFFSFSLLLKMMKDWDAHRHHYTPQTSKYVMVWTVRHNNGHL